jgi:competence protein ComQ
VSNINKNVKQQIINIIDCAFYERDLNQLVHQFIEDKINESSRWSDLTLTTHFMLGGNSPLIYEAAAVAELVMLSLDILDDIQDQDNFEKPWMKCPQENALNIMVGLLMTALSTVGQWRNRGLNVPHLMSEKITETILKAINGQHKDLNDLVNTEEEYMNMIEEKSASLVQMVCMLGMFLLDQVGSEIESKMMEMSRYVGLAAQIGNDGRDITRWDKKNDLLKKKKTLPVLFALAECEGDCNLFKKLYIGDLQFDQINEFKFNIIQFIKKSGALEYSKTMQRIYLKKAKVLLDTIPTISHWNEQFETMFFR